MKKSTQLRNLLKQDGLLVAPGASSALLGKLIELSGFQVVYATGAGIANMQFGVPDIGLATMTEILETTKRINDATSLPVIADIDNGYGNSLNVYRTVKEFSAAGIAALQLEDQQLPKRCGHFNGKLVTSKEEMVSKIKAAKDALVDPDVLLIARTDAIAVNGLEDALERAALYAEAGADILFVEAPTSPEQMRKVIGSVNTYHIANMVEGGKTPILSNQQLAEIGFKIVLYANAPLKAAVKGTQELLNHLRTHGTTADCEELMITMKERNEITGLAAMDALESKYKF
ncbi:MAG: carboxyvinyl-carboxyphosphonate phosphorylmutase [Firmicutes bacterium]|nr:carboxyvinyl-carboxyphosphonate phosphorylmutase [Bacillota bacterium]